ncbi:oligosaccharide flippase family protein, partial [Candidatus Kaiserbacteria bacterium]|nr:oligosaccharide flippase family protein [Candidatus Kaiserbacteria bacterium]
MLKRFISLYRDSLFRNAIYLMLASGVLAAFGFFFWLVSAHLVPTEAIGVATALVSVMNMIAVLSLVGFDTALIRFLSRSRTQNDMLNTSIILVGAAALTFSGFFLVFANHISPQLAFVLRDPYVTLAFMAFCVTSALNILTDAAFIGYRQTVYSLAINVLFSVVKVLLPLLFFAWGAFGIFSAAAAGQAIGFVLSWYVLVSRFGYRPRFTVSREVLSSVWKYSAGNYVSGVLNLLPLTLLPIIVINRLGATQAAYFYIVMTIASLLYVIPTAATRSFFAEGSFDAENISLHLRKSVRIISFLLTPAIAALLLGGSYLLGFFGKSYSEEGMYFLYIVTIAALVVAVYSTYGSLFRIKRNLEALILVNAVYATSILGLTYVFIRYGLLGVGIAWIAGNSITALLSSAVYRLKPPHDLHRYWKGLLEKLDDLAAAVEMFIVSKLLYAQVLSSRRFQRKFVLFYPEKPKTYHVLYRICHALGYTITDDPRVPADAVIDFEDTTIRNPNLVLEVLRKKRKVINISCNDISKETVDRVFAEVFGYGISVDPLTYRGTCVKKSNTNAL